MTDLLAFLTARLDEDEAAAKAAWGVEWDWRYVAQPFGERPSIAHTVHIARHDPARVLREVEAKRAILAEHGPANGGRDSDRCRVCTAIAHTGVGHTDARRFRAPCPTLLILAAIYSDHPDYRQEWALLSTSEERASSFEAPRSP